LNNTNQKKRNLDEIYADIDQINQAIHKDFLEMNVNELSNIVKKESDIYRDTALFNYESISNEDATIESGTVNLSSTNCLNLLCQTTHKMTDRDLINVQNELDNNYTRI